MKIWTIFSAARYDKNGILLESIDDEFKSGGLRLMVELEDYVKLRDELAEYHRLDAEETENYNNCRKELDALRLELEEMKS